MVLDKNSFPESDMNDWTKFCVNPSNSYWDILLQTSNINLMVALQKIKTITRVIWIPLGTLDTFTKFNDTSIDRGSGVPEGPQPG